MPHWLVIDLEATTDDGGWPLEEMEVIEIGASIVTRSGREVDHFQRFIRPVRRSLLTPFCRQLTRITQANIDSAMPMTQVWEQFERWLRQHLPHLEAWASWGDYDRKQLQQEWQQKQLNSALAHLAHHNLKQQFAQARHLKQALGLNSALQLAGLQFHGQQHRALEDARNTARLLPLILAD